MNKLFDYKRKYIASDGEKYIDMCIPAFDYTKVNVSSVLKLNKDHNGRLDNFTYYNVMTNLDNIDTVMYVNHIYNPFAVKDGDIIYTPNADDMYFTQEEPELIDGSKLSDKMNDTKPMTYAENVEYLARLGLGVK